MTAPDAAITELDRLPRTLATFRVATVAALILLIPWRIYLEVIFHTHSPHLAGSGVQSTALGPQDVLLVLLIIASIPLIFNRSRKMRMPIGQLGAALFALVVAVWLIMFPTIEGAMMLVRVAGVPAVILAIRAMSQSDLMVGVVWPLSIGASMQALLALFQTLFFDTGLVVPATTLAVGRGWTAGLGAFSGPYALAAYLMLAMAVALSLGISKRPMNRYFNAVELSDRLRKMLWTTVILTSAAMATTFGRAALLSIGLVGGVYLLGWLIHRQKIMGLSALATLGPLIATGIVLRSGWLVRASQSADLDFTTRDDLAARALEMIRSSPLIGVGPVQYGPHLTRMDLAVLDVHIVHNIPLLVAAEFGIVIGVAFTAWLIALGIRSFRLSVYVGALVVSILPLMLFDNLHYVYGNGIAMFAVWIAMLDYHRDIAFEPPFEHEPADGSAS